MQSVRCMSMMDGARAHLLDCTFDREANSSWTHQRTCRSRTFNHPASAEATAGRRSQSLKLECRSKAYAYEATRDRSLCLRRVHSDSCFNRIHVNSRPGCKCDANGSQSGGQPSATDVPEPRFVRKAKVVSSCGTSDSNSRGEFGDCPHKKKDIHKQFEDIDDAALVALLPRDSCGNPTTIGSMLHASGKCRPCWHALKSVPCPVGMRCAFRHLGHPLSAQSALSASVLHVYGQDMTKRKGKRQRNVYKDLVSKVTQEIMKDPFAWSMEKMKIPTYVEANPLLKDKFLFRMSVITENARFKAAG